RADRPLECIRRMVVVCLVLLARLSGAAVASSAAAQSAPAPECKEWRQCRELALAAAERGEFETFHDLAWRAVQTGPPRDPALLYLLARAQSLSGRVRDALVMLERLADMGAPPLEAAASPDFSKTRELSGWPEFEERLRGMPPEAPAAVVAPPAR